MLSSLLRNRDKLPLISAWVHTPSWSFLSRTGFWQTTNILLPSGSMTAICLQLLSHILDYVAYISSKMLLLLEVTLCEECVASSLLLEQEKILSSLADRSCGSASMWHALRASHRETPRSQPYMHTLWGQWTTFSPVCNDTCSSWYLRNIFLATTTFYIGRQHSAVWSIHMVNQNCLDSAFHENYQNSAVKSWVAREVHAKRCL